MDNEPNGLVCELEAPDLRLTADSVHATLRRWATDPDTIRYIIPPIKSFVIGETWHGDSHSMHASEVRSNEAPLLQVRRTLIPRRSDKDPELVEDVLLERTSHGLSVVASFTPALEDVKNNLPFYYPACVSWSIRYDGGTGRFQIHAVSFPGESLPNSVHFKKLLHTLRKWSTNHAAGFTERRFRHDLLVPRAVLDPIYGLLKTHFAKAIVGSWVEKTDPLKHVYEDLGIASFLIGWLLIKNGYGEDCRDINFQIIVEVLRGEVICDLGCGNGLLVHILSSMVRAIGIDSRRRKSWAAIFSKTDLRESSIDPETFICPDGTTLVVGNHPDELTPWLPSISARQLCSFVVIPCCFYDFQGSKIGMRGRKQGDGGTTRWAWYRWYLKTIAEEVGYGPGLEEEWLRIPSTRNWALVGTWPHSVRLLKNPASDAQLEMGIEARSVVLSLTTTGIGFLSEHARLHTMTVRDDGEKRASRD